MRHLRFAWIRVRQDLGQLLSAVAVIALAVALATSILLAGAALRDAYDESLEALAGRADLRISPQSGGTFSEELVDMVREADGVEAAAPVLVGYGHVGGKTRTRLTLLGIDLLDEATVRLYESADTGLEEPLIFLNDPESVILPSRLAKELGLDRGDVLEFQTPDGRHRLTTREIIRDRGAAAAFGGRLIVMDLLGAQATMGLDRRVSQIDVVAEPGVDPQDIAASLRAALPPHLGVGLIADENRRFRQGVTGFNALLLVMSGAGLLLASLITANRLGTVYQERLWELGILRGMGWTPGELLTTLLTEAFVFSLLGVLLGIPLGIGVAHFILGPVADAMAMSLGQAVFAPEISLRAGPLALAAAAGVLSGVVAAWIPARRSSRLEIADLRARRQRRDPKPDSCPKKVARVGLPPLAMAALALQVLAPSPALGAIAMVLIASAGAVLLQPGLQLASRIIGPAFGGPAWIGTKDQSRAPSRAIGAAAVLMAGVALVVYSATANRSFEQHIVETIMGPRRADLVIDSAFGALALGADQPRLADSIIEDIEAIDGVLWARGEVLARSMKPVTGIYAIDSRRLRNGEIELDDEAMERALERVAAGAGFLASRQLMTTRGKAVGDVFTIMTPSGPLERQIVGVASHSFLAPTGDVIMTRDLFRDYWADPTVTSIDVLLEPGVAIESARSTMERVLSENHKVRVATLGEVSDWYASSVGRANSIVEGLAALALLVALIGTGDALAANILERTRELGILRSFGYSPRSVSMMVLAQAAAVGIVGSTLALVVGLGASLAFVKSLPGLLGWDLELYPTWGAALGAAGLGFVACIAGALPPALRAARLSLVTALRYE